MTPDLEAERGHGSTPDVTILRMARLAVTAGAYYRIHGRKRQA